MKVLVYAFNFIWILIMFIITKNYYSSNKVTIFVANSFHKWSFHYNSGVINCKNNLICSFTNNYSSRINFALYNAWNKLIKYNYTARQKRLLWSLEKISWKKEMIEVGMGVNKYYYGGIDYRLFYSPNHFSQSYLGSFISLKQLINNAKNNIKDIQNFMLRKSIVYIQRKDYTKRTNIVKNMMKVLSIDSYGKNLNNKKWPLGKNKIDIIKQYKFCLAIENSIQTSKINKFYSDDIDIDYSTEKLYDCFEGGSIPIYYGPKNSYIFLPNNQSAIVMGEFSNLKDLILYIKKVENSKDILSQYISWTKTYSKSWYKRFTDTFKFSRCKFCEWVYYNNDQYK